MCSTFHSKKNSRGQSIGDCARLFLILSPKSKARLRNLLFPLGAFNQGTVFRRRRLKISPGRACLYGRRRSNLTHCASPRDVSEYRRGARGWLKIFTCCRQIFPPPVYRVRTRSQAFPKQAGRAVTSGAFKRFSKLMLSCAYYRAINIVNFFFDKCNSESSE